MKKSFMITSMAAFAALCFSLTAQAQGPVVVSDKDDYSPGETALFSTTGFQPNELLDFSVAVSDDNSTWVPDIAWADVPADGSGGAEVDYVVPDTWANKSLQLTVMGLTSGFVATTTFTDSAQVHNVHFAASGLPDGTALTITGEFINTQGPPAHGFSSPFTTPSSSTALGCHVNTSDGVIFTGYDNPIAGVGGHYTLTSITLGGASTDGTLHNLNISGIEGGGEYDTGASNSGGGTDSVIIGNYTFVPDASPTPTPSPSATPSPTPCQNHPPAVTCLTPTADLGSVVGCLGTGTGFGQTFPVSFSTDPANGQGTTVTVKATFTLPSPVPAVTVDVATVTDPDGDTVSVSLTNGTSSVTISGPGTGTAPFSVDIHADDGRQDCNDTADNMCSGTASAQIVYAFNGFFPPLSGQINLKVKQGSGIPVKFQMTDCSGTPITPANFVGDPTMYPAIRVALLVPMVPSGDPTVDDAGMSGDNGTLFRWDPTGMQWIFNLKTNSSYIVGDTYKIMVDLGDGNSANDSATIAIKR